MRRRRVSDDEQVPDDFFAGSSPASTSSTGDQDLRASADTDYSDIDDVGPLGHPGRSEDPRGREASEDEVPIDLVALEVPDAAQLFESQPPAVTPEPEVSIPVAVAPLPAPPRGASACRRGPARRARLLFPRRLRLPPCPSRRSPCRRRLHLRPCRRLHLELCLRLWQHRPRPRRRPPCRRRGPCSRPSWNRRRAWRHRQSCRRRLPRRLQLPRYRRLRRRAATVAQPDSRRRAAAAGRAGARRARSNCCVSPPRAARRRSICRPHHGHRCAWTAKSTRSKAPVAGPNDVESLLITLMPERSAEALRTGVASEWICDLPEVGRVRCMSFRDHRGPGGVFRMMPSRAVTAEQLGLSREIQALAVEPEGLLLVSGPRSSGKRTLMSALIDLINRTRRDHVISIESEINVVHERGGSFISQREVRGGIEDMVAVARAALREDPDVLVLEELRSPALMNLALDAAGAGQLVIGGFPAHSAARALDRIIDLYPPEYRRQVQLSLAQNLRGVVAQVLLRKNTGGRVAAREVLLNTPAVAERARRGEDVAAAADDRGRPPPGHGAAQRRARRLRAERSGRRTGSLQARRRPRGLS